MNLRIVVSNPRWLKRNLPFIRDFGLGIEIVDFANSKILSSSYRTRKRLNFYKKAFCGKCPISLHGANVGLDPGSLNKRIRDLTKEDYFEIIRIANELTVDFIIFHSCIDTKLGKNQLKQWLEAQIPVWKKIDSILNPETQIIFENMYEHKFNFLKTLVNQINHHSKKKMAGVCLDVGHLKLYSREPEKEVFATLQNKIKYLHLQTNNGKFDKHMPISNLELKKFSKLTKSLRINPIICLDYGISDLKKEILRIKHFYS